MSRKHKSDNESPEPPEAEAPATETQPDSQSFADRVGKKQLNIPDPFPIAVDTDAGVRLLDSKRDRQVAIMFGDGSLEHKPSDAVLDIVRNDGFRWDNPNRVWARKYTPETALSTRIHAEKLYQTVTQMIREEKGIGQGVPF